MYRPLVGKDGRAAIPGSDPDFDRFGFGERWWTGTLFSLWPNESTIFLLSVDGALEFGIELMPAYS